MATVEAILWAILAAIAAEWPGLLTGLAIGLSFYLAPKMMQRWKVRKRNNEQPPLLEGTDGRALTGVNSVFLANMDFDALSALGIIACVPSLDERHWAPNDCRLKTKRSLKVCGLQGSKWVDGEDALEDFRNCLRRIQGIDHGSIRFLLVDPYGAAMSDIVKQRGVVQNLKLDERILEKYADLMKEFSCLEVRLYDHLPYFRIVILDENEMAVSRYKISKDRKFGWKSPHLILKEDDNPGSGDAVSLFHAFEKHFDHVWFHLSASLTDKIEERKQLDLENE